MSCMLNVSDMETGNGKINSKGKKKTMASKCCH